MIQQRDRFQADSVSRSSTSLQVLRALGSSSPAVLEAALKALASHQAGEPASAIVEQQLRSGLDPSLVRPAIPRLVSLAAPRHYPGLGSVPATGGGLVAVARLYAAEVEAVLRSLIRNPDKEERASAMECLRALISSESDLVARLLPDVCISVELPDDPYHSGSAADEAAKTLAAALMAAPQATDQAIRDALALASSKGKPRLVNAYVQVLGDWWRNEHQPDAVPGDVYHLAYDRVVEQFATRSGDDVFQEAVKYFDWVGDRCPLNVGRVTALTGIMALLSKDLEDVGKAKPSTVIKLHPDPMAALEMMGRRSRLEWALRVAADAVSGAASRDPGVVIPQVQATFDSVEDSEDVFRAYLVRCLSGPASTRRARRAVLPFLYRAMLDRSPLVRNASIHVVEELTKWDVDDLPTTFCDCFLALLNDRYVIVHRAAVRLLRYRRTVPEEYVPRVRSAVWGWVVSYAKARSDDDFLAEAINVVFYLNLRLGQSMSFQVLGTLLGVLRNMHAPAAFDVVEDRWEAFRDVPGFSAFIISLLGDESLNEYNQRDLLSLLPHLDAVEATTDAGAIWKAFVACAGRGLYEASIFLDMLAKAGKWDSATSFINQVVDRYEDNAWDHDVRTAAGRLQMAVQIEAGLLACDDRVVTTPNAWADSAEDGDA